MPDDEPPSTPSGAEPLILPRRRAAPSREAVEESDHAEEMADLAESVKALSERLNSPALQSGAATEPEARVSRRWKKVARPDQADLLPVPAAAADPTLDKAKPSPPKTRPAGKRHPARRPAPPRRGQSIGVWVAAQAFGFGLIGLGYFVGRLAVPGDPPAASPPGVSSAPTVSKPPSSVEKTITHGVSDRAFQTVNAAMAASKAGDAYRAREALEDAQRAQIAVPGSDYRLAILAIQRGDLKEAKLRLDCAMAANEELAGCCYVRAMLAGATGDYSRAADECAKAAYSEPFNARYLFFWAECLRRNGRLQEAVGRFEEALTRPSNPSDQDYIAFKLRLAKVEAGRSGEFAAELTKRLSEESTPATWLLTAAALQLEARDPAAAARYLQRANRSMAPADFDLQTRDYLFVQHSNDKEVASYFMRPASPVSPSPNVAAITVDPLSWTLQSADPGAWPVAAHR